MSEPARRPDFRSDPRRRRARAIVGGAVVGIGLAHLGLLLVLSLGAQDETQDEGPAEPPPRADMRVLLQPFAPTRAPPPRRRRERARQDRVAQVPPRPEPPVAAPPPAASPPPAD